MTRGEETLCALLIAHRREFLGTFIEMGLGDNRDAQVALSDFESEALKAAGYSEDETPSIGTAA